MTDHLTRVAEAVRDAVLDETVIVEMPALRTVCRDRIDLPAIVASVPRPEPVAAQVVVPGGLLTAADMKALRRFIECAEDCDAGGHDVPKEAMKRLERLGAVRSLGFGRHETTAFGDAMLAAAPEAPQKAVQDRRGVACLTAMNHISTETLESLNRAGIKFDATRGYAEELEAEIATLRSAIQAMASMLQAREWAEHVSTDPVVTDLEVQITELVGTATKLREQNAALVALLVQCALAANTLRVDFEKYATHSGFNDEFVNAVCAAAGVPRNHGYGNAEYQSQRAAIASVKGGA